MLRLKVRIERIDGARALETIALANSGFTGHEPEIALPGSYTRELGLSEVVEPEAVTRVTADGRETPLLRYRLAVRVYVVEDDRLEGPVEASVIALPGQVIPLLNDRLLGALRIVLLDFAGGDWCFRDELGRRTRKSH